jgi:hypothetical protein
MRKCSDHSLLEAYRDHWKQLSIKLIRENSELEEDRDKWKRLFIEMYKSNNGVTDEMMRAYRKEMGAA